MWEGMERLITCPLRNETRSMTFSRIFLKEVDASHLELSCVTPSLLLGSDHVQNPKITAIKDLATKNMFTDPLQV